MKNYIGFSIGYLIIIAIAACSSNNPQTVVPTAIPSINNTNVSASPTPNNQASSSPSPEFDYYEEALTSGAGAKTISQSAVSKEEWELVASQWRKAIHSLKKVPKSDPNYTAAQNKIKEYQASLVEVENKINPPKPVAQQPPKINPTNTLQLVTARNFLEKYFKTNVDEGKDDSYSYWCAEDEILQSSLFSPRSYKILSFNSSSDFATAIVRIESSNRGGSPIIVNWKFNIYKKQTIFERELKKNKSFQLAQLHNKKLGGWCIGWIREINR